MPKLMQLNVTANWGSTGKIAEGIGLAAIDRGWESAIAYGRHLNPSKSGLIKVGNMLDVYCHYFQHKLFDREGLGSKRATQRLIEQIKVYNPDIIHLHNIHDHWLNYPLLFKYLATVDTPIVWTFHDCWAFTGGCAYFDSVNCQQWETKCENCPLNSGYSNSRKNFILKKDLLMPLQGRLTIVPVSHWLEGLVKKSFLKDCRSEMIHNGVNISQFQPSAEQKKMILGVAMPWSARKGLNDIIELRPLLSKDIEIRLIGVDEKQLNAMPDGIKGFSRTQNIDELVRNYSEASVFINPTYQDNFPTVNLEALACGTPIVTYRTGGSPEAVDESTGIVVPKGDVRALADAINKVLDNPGQYSARACRTRAEENFDKTVQFGKYIDLYESILSKQ